jgi:hypothetical protein
MTYGAIGAEPWLYPYDNSRFYRTQTGKILPHVPGSALATPLVLGPGWYKGAQVSYTPPKKDNPMPIRSSRRRSRAYGAIADLLGPPRAILPVEPPIGGTRDPHGPVYAASYIPKGLPTILPKKGWRVGPQVHSDYKVGEVIGDDPSPVPMRIYGTGDYMTRYANNTGFPTRAYGDVAMGEYGAVAYGDTPSYLSMPTIVQGIPLSVPLTPGIAPYMVPTTGYAGAIQDVLDRKLFGVPMKAALALGVLVYGAMVLRKDSKRKKK